MMVVQVTVLHVQKTIIDPSILKQLTSYQVNYIAGFTKGISQFLKK